MVLVEWCRDSLIVNAYQLLPTYYGFTVVVPQIVFACRRWRRRKDKDQVDDYTAIYSATVFDNKDADNQAETAFKPKPMRVTYRPKIPVSCMIEVKLWIK